MYRRNLGFLALALVVFLTGCASRRELSPSTNKVSKDNLISVWAEWVKDKGKKYDIRLMVSNDSPNPFIILLSEMQCWRGNMRGEMKHTFFNTGERTIDFKAGEMKSFNMVCRLGGEAVGDIRVVIGRVLENPGGDGKTLGKVLTSNVEWKIAHDRKD